MRTLNGKWEVLSCYLQAAGWDPECTEPRALARHYHAGRAVIRETNEEHGPRTIYAFAVRWKHDSMIQYWVHSDHKTQISEACLLRGLQTST